MNLSLVQMPKNEMISLKEAKNYLLINHDFDDDLITMLIKSTRIAMESVIQKSILNQTWKYVVNNDVIRNLSATDDQPSFRCGILRIPLPWPPVIKIVRVIADESELASTKYKLEKSNCKFYLHLRCDGAPNYKNLKTVEITYEAGMAESIENIPYQLKLANLMLLANAYRERYSCQSEGLVSQGIRHILAPFLNLRLG